MPVFICWLLSLSTLYLSLLSTCYFLLKMKIVFMGTPEFARPTLEALIKSEHGVASVITQPDRPKGRGLKLSLPPVKILAREFDIPVFQPPKIKDPQVVSYLKGPSPDLIVVVAYGQILPKEVLEIPPLGCINLHASLLPQLRGAAPIAWAIIKGQETTGLTTMYMDEGMDTGEIILQKKVDILPTETTGTLSEKLSQLGAPLVLETLGLIKKEKAPRTAQDDSLATYAPLIKKEDCLINWQKPAQEIYNLIRGLNPHPGAFTYLNGKRLKVYTCQVVEAGGRPAGIVQAGKDRLIAATSKGGLSLLEVQPQGKRKMGIAEFLAGHRIEEGMAFGLRIK